MMPLFKTIIAIAEVPLKKSSFAIQRNYHTAFYEKRYQTFFQSNVFKQSRRYFKSDRRKPTSPGNANFEGIAVDSGPMGFGSLTKPLIFTLMFSTGSIAGCAIWQYENMRSQAITAIRKSGIWFQHTNKKAGKWREEINQLWNSLREDQRVFIPIFIMNALVFAAWRIPRLQPAMVKYFCSNPASRIICWPMVLSTFSHYSLFHLLANMFVLNSFSSGVIHNMGKEQFLGMYLAGGVISSFGSYLHKILTRQPGLSLGASGAIMAILGYVCSEYPETRLSIIFLPMYTFSAGAALKVLVSVDLVGILIGWKFFDHAAHLGGALWGICWCYWGNAYIWQKREPLLQYWHKFRGGISK